MLIDEAYLVLPKKFFINKKLNEKTDGSFDRLWFLIQGFDQFIARELYQNHVVDNRATKYV